MAVSSGYPLRTLSVASGIADPKVQPASFSSLGEEGKQGRHLGLANTEPRGGAGPGRQPRSRGDSVARMGHAFVCSHSSRMGL